MHELGLQIKHSGRDNIGDTVVTDAPVEHILELVRETSRL
jgi:hypothetical protein